MAELDLDDLIGSAREVEQAGPEHADQLFDRLMVSIGAGGIGAAGGVGVLGAESTAVTTGAAGASTSAATVTAGTASGLKVALTVGALAGAAGALVWSSTENKDDKATAPVASSPLPAEARPATKSTTPDEQLDEQSAELSPPTLSEAEQDSLATPQVPRKPVTRKDTLAAEVALVRKAKLSLNQKRYQDALRSLDQYRKQFPQGTLRGEAQATRVLVLCALNQSGQARTAANEIDGDLGVRMKDGCKRTDK